MGVFISRLIPVARTIIAIPAGVLKMDFLKYTIYSACGIFKMCIRDRVVRGILKGSKSNMIIQIPDDSMKALDGLTIDGTDFTLNKIEDFKMRFGISELAINGNVYYMLAKFCLLYTSWIIFIYQRNFINDILIY